MSRRKQAAAPALVLVLVSACLGCASTGVTSTPPPATAPPPAEPAPSPAPAGPAAPGAIADRPAEGAEVKPAAAPPPRLAWVNPARCLSGCDSPPAGPLVAVDDAGAAAPDGGHRVVSEIQPALAALIAAGRAAGHQLRINSAYRSFAEQARLYRSVKAPGRVARPGHSEHQLGTAVDLDLPGPESAAWLASTAPGFGFALSYPPGKQRTTGYRPEPWHVRHVGQELATLVARQGLSLEELFRQRPELAESGTCEDCPGGALPARVPCGKVSEVGVCRGPVLTWCFEGTLARVDCSTFAKSCGREPGEPWPDCR